MYLSNLRRVCTVCSSLNDWCVCRSYLFWDRWDHNFLTAAAFESQHPDCLHRKRVRTPKSDEGRRRVKREGSGLRLRALVFSKDEEFSVRHHKSRSGHSIRWVWDEDLCKSYVFSKSIGAASNQRPSHSSDLTQTHHLRLGWLLTLSNFVVVSNLDL
jgi:hypothetical protein